MNKNNFFNTVIVFMFFGLINIVHSDVFAYPAGGLDGTGPHAAVFRDAAGMPVRPGSATPYSPKQTCGLSSVNGTNCHIDIAKSFGLSSGNTYESGIGYAVKDDGAGTASYSVPYPLQGISAGFHFQQGRDVPWGTLQRSYYGQPGFTGSPGVYGGYDPATGRRLAALHEGVPGSFDMSSYDFTSSSCAWCHPGGGPLEYDREGYRYDGTAGLFQSGPNPLPSYGDYYSYDPASGTITSRAAEWQSGGVAEVDCLICHAKTTIGGFRYSMLERNFALSEGRSPALAASLGLVGVGGNGGFLNIAAAGGNGINPDIGQSGWSWNTARAANANEIPFNAVINAVPDKENCALCHFADKSLTDVGPAGLLLGDTLFQKLVPAGTAEDSDEIAGVAGRDGKNDTAWKVTKGKSETSKRAGSINDPLNPDIHMDRDKGNMTCSACHYLLGSSRNPDNDCITCHANHFNAVNTIDSIAPTMFPAITDASGNVIQPARAVARIDHQFAKGNSNPGAMLLDQFDNTATCASCHITRTHPNTGSAPNPAIAHSSFPAFHFDLIDCRTCHIPVINGPYKEILADLTAGPYRTFERKQMKESPAGVNYQPLYVWREGVSAGSPLQIAPVSTLAAASWSDRLPDGSYAALPLRLVRRAAEGLRAYYGDANGDGLYDWTLNAPQNGSTALIINTRTEISDMVNQLRLLGVNEPVLTISVGTFTLSHNVATKASGKILGSPAGGGCVMCHSSDDPASPNYSTKSVGFFSKT
ncbi:MAG: hypothetical protein AB1553_16050, partial [Nitrospirota bacterium]